MQNKITIPTIRKPTVSDYILSVALALVWASAFLVIKVAVPETGPLWLATMRVMIAFIVLLPLAIAKGVIWPASARQWVLILMIMLLNVVLPFFLISWAELRIDAGITSILMGVGPFMAIIGSHFTTQDDKLSVPKFIGVVLGFVGVVILVGWETLTGIGQNLVGQGAALLGAASYVTSGLLIRKVTGFPPLRLSTLILGLSTVSLLSLTLIFEGLPEQNFSSQTWVGLIYLGLFPTAIGYILRYKLIQSIGLSAFTFSINLIPVFGVVLAAIFLGEVVSVNIFLFLMYIIAGLTILRLGHRR